MAFAPSVMHCADTTTDEQTEMSVRQVVHLSFGAMNANVPETATVTLDDLRSVPDFAVHRERFDCVALDREETRLTISQLAASGPDTAVALTTSFRGQDADTWTPWMSFEGIVEQDESLGPEPETISEAGEVTLETLVLTDDPLLDLRVEAEVAQEVDTLVVELVVVLFFSTQIADCSERQTTQAGDQRESSEPADL